MLSWSPDHLARGFSFATTCALMPTWTQTLRTYAQAAGKDHMDQTWLAIQAVQRARPDMTASDALAAVNLMRRS